MMISAAFGLRLVFQIHADAGVVAGADSRRESSIVNEPTNQVRMRAAVALPAHRRGREDFFDQLGLFELGHRFVAPFKLGARQRVPGFQGRNPKRASLRNCLDRSAVGHGLPAC
jgi:hypothetical protein